MTKTEAIARVKDIELSSMDDEAAHSMEDRLHTTFINEMALGRYKTLEEAQEIASIISETESIEFARWCA